MTTNFLPVEPIELSREEKTELEEIMRVGNLRLEYWHNLLKKENDTLGRKFSRSKLGDRKSTR